MISFTHFRHATSIININDKRILIDPLLAARGSYPPIQMTKNTYRNPLIDLPVNYEELFDVDGVLITHNHNDHFDELAKKELPRDIAILCQINDYEFFKELGFTNLTAICEETNWLGLQWKRFSGTHGGGIYHKRLGVSSSYMVTVQNQKIYFTGDTLLTGKIKKLLKKEKPHIIIANGGGARLKIGGKITMSHRDLLRMSRILPTAQLLAIHMDSLNHCQDRSETMAAISNKNPAKILIPTIKTIIL
jgi:L-ascorbate metabolism protein UlaG (beta-lactamase superfamily)